MIVSDSYFSIGSQHTVNQDYALSGVEPFPYLIVADGCSSSTHTDVGARLLSWATRDCLQHTEIESMTRQGSRRIGLCALNKAHAATRALGLDALTVLDSTLLVAFAVAGNLYISVFGDGVIALKSHQGDLQIFEVEYSHNAPWYLSYEADPLRAQRWRTLSIEATKRVSLNGNPKKGELTEPLLLKVPLQNISMVLLASDGVQSVKKGFQLESLSTLDAIEQLSDFKNRNGEFLKRRIKRQLNEWSKENIVNQDDLALACMLIA